MPSSTNIIVYFVSDFTKITCFLYFYSVVVLRLIDRTKEPKVVSTKKQYSIKDTKVKHKNSERKNKLQKRY